MAAYCPDAGDLIWLDFLQPVANEQAGRRPALVLSPRSFNALTGRCIACPITRRDRDWAFHVPIPEVTKSPVSCRRTKYGALRGSSGARGL